MKNEWNSNNIDEAKKLILSINNEALPDQKFDEYGKADCELLLPFVNKDSVVLDFGCGIGRVAKPLSKYVKKVICYDKTVSMLLFGKHNYCKDINNIDWINNFRGYENKVDFVYSFLTFQHIPYRQYLKAIKQIDKVLTENGKGIFHYSNFKDAVKPYSGYNIKTIVDSLVPYFNIKKIEEVDGHEFNEERYDLSYYLVSVEKKGMIHNSDRKKVEFPPVPPLKKRIKKRLRKML